MDPEDRIRMLMEENARLRAQIQGAPNPYAGMVSPEDQAFQQSQDEAMLRDELDRYREFVGGPMAGQYLTPPQKAQAPSPYARKESQYLRKEKRPARKPKPVGLD